MTKESFDLDAVELPPLVERKMFTGEDYIPFQAEENMAPPFLPIGGKTLVRQTSSTHGQDGYITIDPEVIAATQKRLEGKILAAEERITLFEEDLKEDTDTLVISYGVTARAVEDASLMLEQKGKPVSTLTLKSLWPVPEKLLKKKAESFKRVVVIEMNQGQYVGEIQKVLRDKKIDFYGQMDGVLITPAKIMEVIEND